MVNSLPALPTIGVIAEKCNKPPEKVDRRIKQLGIKPVARAGTFRVFSLEDVEKIRRDFIAEEGSQ